MSNFCTIANVKVAGTSFRQEQVWALRKAENAYLTLRREPKNENDPKAIKVLAHATSKGGKKSVYCVGYIPKNKNIYMADDMDAGRILRVKKDYTFVGGYDGKTLGLRINIARELPEKVAVAEPVMEPAEA